MSFPACTPTRAGRQFYRRPRHPINWTEGDIAFLMPYTARRSEYDALSVPIPEKATCHPVIILKVCSTGSHYVVTTVSAYGVAPNGGPAPWTQHAHRYKSAHDFRAFVGTAPYVDDSGRHGTRALLNLGPGMQMPKPRTSWVYARTAFLVPASVLGVFSKSKTHLRMTTASLDDLRAHMAQCSSGKGGYRVLVDASSGRVNCACCCRGLLPRKPPVVPLLHLVTPLLTVDGAVAAVTGSCRTEYAPGPNHPLLSAIAPAGSRSFSPPPTAVPVVPVPTPAVQVQRTWAAIVARA
ncbi:hypothetical protein MCOR25_006689 [Pyricularia grisea]|uniref:Uncharacterized protein n=1 Tax=Pyricularia grisea TaxID=148305 RepID=A0A6P8ANN0_PYRGI|nr:uncharacterized protein PgNI_11850 [Pyricularia grisea]KAI6360604.1 hypothetical protein MCOR25_006689 [Pyricularia grisea]TLD03647.1 hypothetical protein PgNI_11850 [Pyricularia grisea]